MLFFVRSFVFGIAILFLLTACGGGGGGGGGSGGEENISLNTAYFIDSGVEGLEYSSNSYQGVTGTNGGFVYEPGETTTFSYYGLQLGSVVTTSQSAVFTPLDLFATTDINNQAVKNTLVLLQTLDGDQNASNGISLRRSFPPQLPPNLSTLDISSAGFQGDLIPALGVTFGTLALIAEPDALDHFNDTLDALNAVSVLDGRWIQRDAKYGDVDGVYTFIAGGSFNLSEFDDCANNDIYWAASEASAKRNCTENTYSGSWSLDGKNLTMTSTSFSDECIIISSSPYAIEANCRFMGSGLGSELTRFERDITDLSNTLINNSYHEFVPGALSDTITIFSPDLTGSYQYIDANGVISPDDTGVFNWSTNSSQLSISGIDGAGASFSQDFDLVEDVRGALSTNGKINVLIPDFDSNLVSGLIAFGVNTLRVYDAIDGSCKGFYNFNGGGTDGTFGTLRKFQGNGDVCEFPVGGLGLPELAQVNQPVPIDPGDFVFTLDDIGAVVIEGGGIVTREICWPVYHSTTSDSGSFSVLACSKDGAPFVFEIWQKL